MKILKHQSWHLLFLIAVIAFIWRLIRMDAFSLSGSYLGITTRNWLVIAITTPIVHQIYVLICWRVELHFKGLTNMFGSKVFAYYKIGFFILFLGRFITIIFLAISSSQSFELKNGMKYSIIVLLSIPALYAFYSVKKYFGFDKAAGLDHFDVGVSKQTFVKRGIFKYTNNGMYKFAFLIFYVPGIIWLSEIALIVALFSHTYIWVHFYCTELPDIKIIYQSDEHTKSV